MSKQMNQFMTDWNRLLARQQFQSEEELQAFLYQLTGHKVPSFPKRELTIQEQAQDLVFATYGLPPEKAWENALKALDLDPDCIEAYELLGTLEPVPHTAIAFYERVLPLAGSFLEAVLCKKIKVISGASMKRGRLCAAFLIMPNVCTPSAR